MKKSKDILNLFISFVKIGAFTFGGGYAMIPLIQKEAVDTHKWVNNDDILDILAIAESTPGVLAVNSATFIGYKVAGFWGSLIATLGVVLPSFIIIMIVSFFYDAFRSNEYVNYAFYGIRAGVSVLLLNTVMKLAKTLDRSMFSALLVIVSFFLSTLFNINAIYIIIFSAVVGIIYTTIMRNKNEEFKEDKK